MILSLVKAVKFCSWLQHQKTGPKLLQNMCSCVLYVIISDSEHLWIPVNEWYLWIPSYHLDSDVKYVIHKKMLSAIYSLFWEKSQICWIHQNAFQFFSFPFYITFIHRESIYNKVCPTHFLLMSMKYQNPFVPSLLLNTRRKRSSIKASTNEGKRETLTVLQWKWSLWKNSDVG